jgi:multicomponent K+:H+ antiporter subunit E
MISHWFPHPLASAILLLVWMMLNSTVAFAHVLLGAFLAWGIPWLSRLLLARRVRLHHPLLALRLLLTVIFDIVVANLHVARLILGPVSALRPAFVRIPLALQEPYAIFTLASIITLTPGTVSAVLSEDRRFLLVHVLDLEDAHALIAGIKARYETPLMEIFEC